MNWTGGRLKRHARSHGREELKVQKNFFARSCLRKQGNQVSPTPGADLPLQLKESSLWEAHLRGRQASLASLRPLLQQHSQDLGQSFQHGFKINATYTDTPRKASPNRTPFSRQERHCEIKGSSVKGDTRTGNVGKPASTRAVSTSMDNMKKKLLAQPDWLGLSTHRPARIDFPPTSDIAKIGRHRKITQSTDSDTKRPPLSHSGREHRTKAVIGKRKRSDHGGARSRPEDNNHNVASVRSQMHASTAIPQPLWNVNERQSEGVAQARASNHQVDLLPKDENRHQYRLLDDNLSLEDATSDLVSLDEARTLSSFDALKERYLELNRGRSFVKDRDHSNTGKFISQATFSGPIISRSDSCRDSLCTVQEYSSTTSRDFETTPSKRMSSLDNGTTLGSFGLPVTPTVEKNDQHQLASSVHQSRDQCALLQGEMSFATAQNSGVAARDFAYASPSTVGAHKAPTAESRTSTRNVGQLRLQSPVQEARGKPAKFESIAIAIDSKTPRICTQAPTAVKGSTTLRPRIWFRLDEEFERKGTDDLEHEYNVYSKKQRSGLKHTSFSTTATPTHYTYTRGSKNQPGWYQQRHSPSETSSKAEDSELNDDGLQNMKSVEQNHQYEYRKTSFPRTLQPPTEDGQNIAVHPMHQSSTEPSYFNQEQHVVHEEASFPLDSSSSGTQTQGNTPITIFSTPPRDPTPVFTVSNSRAFIPLHQAVALDGLDEKKVLFRLP